jgi:hypothetical protein
MLADLRALDISQKGKTKEIRITLTGMMLLWRSEKDEKMKSKNCQYAKNVRLNQIKNVLVLSSSPRKGGNSDLLVDQFMLGAREAGNQTEEIFLRDKKIDLEGLPPA